MLIRCFASSYIEVFTVSCYTTIYSFDYFVCSASSENQKQRFISLNSLSLLTLIKVSSIFITLNMKKAAAQFMVSTKMPLVMNEWLYFGFYTNQLVHTLVTSLHVKTSLHECRSETRRITLWSIHTFCVLMLWQQASSSWAWTVILGTSEKKNKFVIVFHRLE